MSRRRRSLWHVYGPAGRESIEARTPGGALHIYRQRHQRPGLRFRTDPDTGGWVNVSIVPAVEGRVVTYDDIRPKPMDEVMPRPTGRRLARAA